MTLAVSPPRDPASPAADLFGLWQPVQAAVDEQVSFSVVGGEALPEAGTPAAVWQLPLTSGPAGRAEGEKVLERRASQVQAIFNGLDQADQRAEAFISARASGQASSGVSFGFGSPGNVEPLAAPEATLAFALDSLAPAIAPGASFGLGEDLARLENHIEDHLPSHLSVPGMAQGGVNWQELQNSLEGMLDRVNRLLLHFAWVDTTLDGSLIARTTVDWEGDLMTLWQTGLRAEQTVTHYRSLQLALSSRLANLDTVLTVTKIAGKIALAVATPLGPLQAMSLGWQFVHDVVMPFLDQA